eukprot:1156191-Pyramimonas_sp.AAC.1
MPSQRGPSADAAGNIPRAWLSCGAFLSPHRSGPVLFAMPGLCRRQFFTLRVPPPAHLKIATLAKHADSR